MGRTPPHGSRRTMRAVRWCALAAAVLFLASCPFPVSGVFPLVMHADSIVLRWDPAWGVSSSEAPFIQSYRVYYRVHRSVSWILLAEVPPSDTPELRIMHDELGDGAFDFAVGVLGVSGIESALHESSDPSADPAGGWYLVWMERPA